MIKRWVPGWLRQPGTHLFVSPLSEAMIFGLGGRSHPFGRTTGIITKTFPQQGSMVNIMTDSCSDLSPEQIEKCRVELIRLKVFINNRTYEDGLGITTPELFHLAAQTRQLPKTSAPPTAEFIQFFDRPGDSLYIGISSKLSATVPNALAACQSLPDRNIRILDSLNLSAGIGLLVLKATELRDEGHSVDEIETAIQSLVPRVRTSFVIDTLDYLYMGGRCSALSMVVGSLLKIRPVIEVRPDGTLGVREKMRGTRKRALDAMLAEFKDHLRELDLHRVFVTHTGCEADAAYLAAAIRELAPVEDLCITAAGSTIASHCGPDTIGILYLMK